MILLAENSPAEALSLLETALAERPDSAIYHNNQGNAFRALGRPSDAVRAFQEALRLDPDYDNAQYNLGCIAIEQGRGRDALAALDAVLARNPSFGPAIVSKAVLLRQAGRLAQAEACLRLGLAAAPETPELWIELGALLREAGRIDAAIPCHERAVALLPRRAAGYNDLGALYHVVGRIQPALVCFDRALALDPKLGHAWFNRGKLLADSNRFEESVQALERAIAFEPTLATEAACHLAVARRHLCDWRGESTRTADLAARIESLLRDPSSRGLPPLTLNVVEIPATLRLAVARHLGRGVEREALSARGSAPFHLAAQRSRTPLHTSPREPSRMRVGYVSPDFRQHAVGSLIHDLFRHHDRSQFEVVAYSLVTVDDAFSRSIRAGVDQFVDISRQTARESAERIHCDRIDILVDLAGYTTHSKTKIFALRPAPLQMHWLGYLDTMGADFLPYLIADATVIPDEALADYSETIVTLPGGFAISSPLAFEATPPRSALGLAQDAFVFCCMNGLHKLDAAVFDAWMQILARVPNGVLWLADEGSPAARANLEREASARGIARERLVFAPRAALPAYLARYRAADLFLDTFAYNAGATAVGALRAGLPVLTRPSGNFMGRMGASLCRAAGLSDMVCPTTEDYVERAVSLAVEGESLARIRERLAAAQKPVPEPSSIGDADRRAPEPEAPAPLFDLPGFARQIEAAYRATWRHQAEANGSRRVEVEP